MSTAEELNKITGRQRDALIEHMDGACAWVVRDSPRLKTVRSLLAHEWIRLDDPARPRRTLITDRGREVLAALLADWADALALAAEKRGAEPSRPFVNEAREVAEAENLREAV